MEDGALHVEVTHAYAKEEAKDKTIVKQIKDCIGRKRQV
jgi:hypothetical protein